MPNLDIPVHALTKDSTHYGCQTRVRQPAYAVPVRRWNGRFYLYETAVIQDTSSPACRQYPLWDADRKCKGCTQQKDTEYRDKMEGLK